MRAVIDILRAIGERLARGAPPTYRFPPHIEAVRLNPLLLGIHLDTNSQHKQNPAVQTTAISPKRTTM